jgi:leucyl-tRNA synthetase
MAKDGRKMSKRWNNAINPDDVVEKYGADAMRVYEMFMGPFDNAIAWSDEGLVGARKFLERVWKLKNKINPPFATVRRQRLCRRREGGWEDFDSPLTRGAGGVASQKRLEPLLHKTIKKVTEDIQNFKFNTAISSMMILLNAMEKEKEISKDHYADFLILLSPFAPHITEELWREIGNKESIFNQSWPKYNEELIKDEQIELVVQINGKVRDRISVESGISEEEAKETALASEKIKKWLDGKQPKKIIFVKGKLVSIVA